MKEAIKNITEAAPAPVAPPVQAPAPTPSPYYTPPPPPNNIPPMYASGGMDSMEDGGDISTPKRNPIKEFFSGVNVLDVAISAFIVAGVFYAIQYYKFVMMLEKTGYADLSSRVQKLESAMAAKKQSEMNATGGKTMRRKRAVITL
jgi:hypothetical protein